MTTDKSPAPKTPIAKKASGVKAKRSTKVLKAVRKPASAKAKSGAGTNRVSDPIVKPKRSTVAAIRNAVRRVIAWIKG